MQKLILEDLNGTDDHIRLLFKLFQQKRKSARISSSGNLSYEDHCRFVSEHPYRYWLLVKIEDLYIGSVNISYQNSISIQLFEDYRVYFNTLINQVLETFDPLAALPSIRSSYFIINVSPDNTYLENELQKIGAKCIQKTFILRENENA
jgi:hypothetical protein